METPVHLYTNPFITREEWIEASKELNAAPKTPTPLPDWITAHAPTSSTASDKPAVSLPVDSRKLQKTIFEMIYPRVIDLITTGHTITEALAEIPQITNDAYLNRADFLRWLKRDSNRVTELKEAEEIRAELWADKMLQHAVATDSLEDIARSKLVVDTLKWRIGAEYNKKYGDKKSVSIENTISITSALAQANARVIDINDSPNMIESDE